MDTPTHPDLTTAAEPTDQRASVALRTALAMLVPLARWLVKNGVPYASFAPALKTVFVEAARRELAEAGARITDSSLSVLSGVHRRDIRAFGQQPSHEDAPRTPSVASQVFTRWVTDPEYRGADQRPLALPKLGPAPSFDALARRVSSDVHPRTLLAEMERLELVQVEGDQVRLASAAFVPQHDFPERAATFAANVGDHIAAAAHNLGPDEGRFLEHAVFGSGLTERSVLELAETARELWQAAFEQMVREATTRFEQDRDASAARMRMRFGAYFFSEPDDDTVASAGQEPVAP